MRIAIVEDDPDLLEKLGIILSGEDNLEVIGSFNSAEDALANVKGMSPEVMLVDLVLPGMSGVELIRKIREEVPAVDVIAYTGFEDRETMLSAIRAGASGYILKGASPRELIEAIQDVCKGGAPMSHRIARAVINELQSNRVSNAYIVSHREREVLKAIEEGLTYKEAAERFNISHHTVHTHIKNIYEKLQAKGRKDALQKARRKGII